MRARRKAFGWLVHGALGFAIVGGLYRGVHLTVATLVCLLLLPLGVGWEYRWQGWVQRRLFHSWDPKPDAIGGGMFWIGGVVALVLGWLVH